MFKLRFKNPHDFNADFGGVGIETVIAFNMFWHIMPVVTIKQHGHFKMRNVGIGDESTQFILLNVIKAHHVKQGIAKRFKTVFARVFKGALYRAALYIFGYMGRLDLFLFATVGTGKSHPLALAVQSKTLGRAKIMLANICASLINYFTAKVTWDILTRFFTFPTRFCGISGSARTGTIIPFAILNQVGLLKELFFAMVARYQLTIKFSITRAGATSPPTITRTVHERGRTLASALKLYAAVLASEGFYNLISLAQSFTFTLNRTIHGYSIGVSCKFILAILARKRFHHTDIIAQERTFYNV